MAKGLELIKKTDISFVLGIFTSSLLVWIYLYSTIIDITTEEPSAISLLYLCFSHYLSFLCVLFAFVLMLKHGLDISLEEHEVKKLHRFNKLAVFCHKTLFSLWGPMFIISITAVLSQSIFSGLSNSFFEEGGGFIVGTILCILFFNVFLRVNIFTLLGKTNEWFIFGTPIYALVYSILLSFYAADVKYKLEKDFYTTQETARFEIKTKGYVFLPTIKTVIYNFKDTLEQYTDRSYFIDLKEHSDERLSLVEINYTPQVFNLPMHKYIYINKAPK